jgi:hypothetical protein
METKNIIWNVRVSKTERKNIAELAKRLGVKESKAFRYALHVALEATDPQKNPDASKNVLVIA